MKLIIMISVILNILLGVFVYQYIDDRRGYEQGYNVGRKDTARAFAKAELEGKIYQGYPLVLGNGIDINGCWFISGSNSDPIIDLRGNDITLSGFYIDMVDVARGTTAIQVSPWFVSCEK